MSWDLSKRQRKTKGDVMTITSRKLTKAVGACALSLTLALAGCASGTEATTETTADSESTVKTVEIPEELEQNIEATKGAIEDTDEADASGFDELPQAEDDNVAIPETSNAPVEVGLDSADKAPSGYALLTSGGVQMQVPSTWYVGQDEDGFVLVEPNNMVKGYLYSIAKVNGRTYDIETIVQSSIMDIMKKGFSKVEMIGYETYYSSSSTLCDVATCFSAEYEGTTYVFFKELVESKSYINVFEVSGTYEQFASIASDIATMSQSLCFNSGEQI